MEIQYLRLRDILERFPLLKPGRVDFLVREGHVTCVRRGNGQPRLFPPESVEQIRSYLDRRQANTVKEGKA